jgi:hypothetical protein
VRPSILIPLIDTVLFYHFKTNQDGVVPALVALGRVTDDVFFSSDGQDTAVRHNCASALRSLTCKAEIRTLLIEGGAISVILDDAQVTVILILSIALTAVTEHSDNCLC